MAIRHTWKLCRKVIPFLTGAGLLIHNDKNELLIHDNNTVKLDALSLEKLSHSSMIKQSAVDAVNSASTVLTVAYTSIESASQEYRQLLSQLINLMEETLLYEVSDDHQDMIISVRSEMNSKKKAMMDLFLYMDHVEKMVESVTVISQSAGMDNLAMSLSQRMDDALQNKDRAQRENEKLEAEYMNMERKCVESR